ncbi:cytochrome P450 [Nannocystaceae bacterium ST9]
MKPVLPPGPRGRLRCSMRMATDPVEASREWRAAHGSTFRVPMFPNDWIMTCDPELVRQILGNRDPGLFFAGVSEAIEPLFGARSILRLADERHNRERKMMMPPFHGERMRGWARTMADIGRRAFTLGREPVRALDRARRVTLEVILRLVFGVRDDARVASFQRAIEIWADSIDPLFIFLPVLARDWLGLSPYARYREHSERVDAMLYEQIAAVRAGEPSDDVLSMLVHARYDDGAAMDELSLRDNLRTLLFAGHDTTAITLAWALWFVHRNPKVFMRLRDELDALGPDVDPDALARVPYLEAVIDETLRMRPINPETQRRLAKPWTLGEWQLPAGVTLGINQVLLHYDEQHWVDPHRFDPERFIGQHPSPNVYTPFGGGNRRCLGATFARYEAAIVLGTLLREFEFELLDEQVEWRRGKLILEPIGGVNLRVRPRSSLRAAA